MRVPVRARIISISHGQWWTIRPFLLTKMSTIMKREPAHTPSATLASLFKEVPPHQVQHTLFKILHDKLAYHEQTIFGSQKDLYVLYLIAQEAAQHLAANTPTEEETDEALRWVFNALGHRKDWPPQHQQTLRKLWQYVAPLE